MLRQAGDRQRALFEGMRMGELASPGEVCRTVWSVLSAPRSLQLFRLFFEVYGMALAAPDRFPGFFPGAVSNWLAFLERSAVGDAESKTLARRRATVVLAGFRGFLLDLCATHERKRVDDAVDAWIDSLDSLATQRAVPHKKPGRGTGEAA